MSFETSEASADTRFSPAKNDIPSVKIRDRYTPDMDKSSEWRKSKYPQGSEHMDFVGPGHRLHELRLGCKGENASDPWGNRVQHVTSRNPCIERSQRDHHEKKHHDGEIVPRRIPRDSPGAQSPYQKEYKPYGSHETDDLSYEERKEVVELSRNPYLGEEPLWSKQAT